MRTKLQFLLVVSLVLLSAMGAMAQTQTPPDPQFAFTGFIQEATLDNSGEICSPASPRLAGGTITVNGIKIIVPCNTILQLPANTMTWAELFDPANSAPIGTTYVGSPGSPVPANPLVPGIKTGLALADDPMPFPSFQVTVVGNVAGKNADGTDRYIAALILPVEQQVLNGASGIVSYIDYAFGSLRVGGLANDPNCSADALGGGPFCSGTLLQFNDPKGRWGLPHSPDPRFSGDDENVTIHASTGIPVCIPRVAPPGIDSECPLGNRPLNGDPRFAVDPFLANDAPLKKFQMPPPPGQAGADPTGFPDATKQVPIMVGDQVLWSGTLYKIDPAGLATPDNTYMSVHTLEDVLGIFTAPGVPPSYVFVEGLLIGAGGAAVEGITQESTTRLVVVGFVTDPTRFVEIYAQDINPCSGQESLRLLAVTDPSTQPLVGRFVHSVLGGSFGAPTRNYVVKSRTRASTPQIVANGIIAGQYMLPNFEFIVPENHRLGDPTIPGNYQDFPFLALGSGPIDGFGTDTPIVRQLDPWPGSTTPTPSNCSDLGMNPVVNAGDPFGVAAGAQVLLRGSVSWDSNSISASHTVKWTQTGGTPVNIQNSTSLVANFLAPTTPGPLSFTLTATDNIGTGSAATDIVVLGTPTDAVTIQGATFRIVPATARRPSFIRINVSATSSDAAAILRLAQVSIDGTTVGWGTGAKSGFLHTWREIKGAPQPARLNVRSSLGGTASVTCVVDADGRGVCQ
ncbi:MAG: hypothetical protein AAGU11_03260 [Syntrophobacteraceae bacterium]